MRLSQSYKTFFGVNVLTLFCKLDRFISVLYFTQYTEMV